MITLLSRLLGTANVELVWTLTQLCATTMFFGYVTELWSAQYIVQAPPAPDEDRVGTRFFGSQWQLTRVWRPHTLLERMQFHLLGYIPYVTTWAVLIVQYERNRADLAEDFPDFLPAAVYGTFAAFSAFGLVQLANQLDCGWLKYGPSVYWLSEATYIVLSFVAKANLGFVVIFSALDENRFDALLRMRVLDA